MDKYEYKLRSDEIKSLIKEREFVKARFYDEESQLKIAENMGVSQMYVSRMERKILKKLRNLYFRD